MIDLHIHTVYSDGDKTVEEILKMCEEKNIECISITDHDTCKQYQDEILKNNTIFSGRIIKGSELHAMFQNENIEILAYNINPGIIDKWCEKYYSNEILNFGNIDGYVCLRSVLVFGFSALLLMYLIVPLCFYLAKKMPKKAFLILSYTICAIFLFDELYNLIFANLLNLPRASEIYKELGFKYLYF